MGRNFWDFDRDVLVSSAELHKYYGEMIVKGEINPEECSFPDYMTDCLGKNGTLISIRGAINENATNDAMEIVNFGIERMAERYGLEVRADDYPDVDIRSLVDGVDNYVKATLLSALAREEN